MDSMWQKSNWPYYLLALSVILVLLGGSLSLSIQSNSGVTVKHTRFAGSNGIMRGATLYIPSQASTDNPAPGIVATHGYINTRDTMEPVSLELARRGYVVLNVDQTGHGLSDPPAFANGFGGIGSLNYLKSLDFVHDNNIGLIGHSMGGPASIVAAYSFPKSYKSIALIASAPRYAITTYLDFPYRPHMPKNVGVIWDKYDEFSQLMAGSKLATGVKTDPIAENLFGTEGPIEEGKLYGSIQNGTARELDIINTIHPFMTQNGEAIKETVDWIQRTVPGGKDTSPSKQVWVWHETGSLIAYIGVILAIFPIGVIVLKHPFFNELKENVPKAMGLSGMSKWLGAALAGAIGILTYFPLTEVGYNMDTSAILPQQITNGVMTWALANGAIVIALFLIWHFMSNRDKGASLANYGITWGDDNKRRWRRIVKALLFGFSVVALVYFLASFCNWAFKVSPHYWVFTIKQFTVDDFVTFLSYLAPFTFYFLAFGILFHGEFRSSGSSETSLPLQMIKNFFIITIPFAILLLAEYIPRLMGGTLLTGAGSTNALWTIIAFQFIPILGTAALVSTFLFRKTGRIYPGAFVNGTLITWLIVASQATHVI